jgi:hypothetical protein
MKQVDMEKALCYGNSRNVLLRFTIAGKSKQKRYSLAIAVPKKEVDVNNF